MNELLSDYEKAIAVINDLAKEYENWVRADLKRLGEAYEKALFQKTPARDQILKADVFRISHDIKGQGATFDYELMTTVGNHLCRYIERQTDFGPLQMEAIKWHIDVMNEIINTHLTGDGGQRGSEIIKKMETF